MPLREGVPVPPGVTPIDALRPLDVDYAALGAKLDDLTRGYLKTWLDATSGGAR